MEWKIMDGNNQGRKKNESIISLMTVVYQQIDFLFLRSYIANLIKKETLSLVITKLAKTIIPLLTFSRESYAV